MAHRTSISGMSDNCGTVCEIVKQLATLKSNAFEPHACKRMNRERYPPKAAIMLSPGRALNPSEP